MKCKFCGQENHDVNKLRDHMGSHVDKYGNNGLTVRQFLLLVQLFYGELPTPRRMKEIIADTEAKVDEAIKDMEIAA